MLSTLFINEKRVYNGESQEWVASLGNTEDESCSFLYDDIVLGERIVVHFTSNSADAGNYYAVYNCDNKEADGKVEVYGEGSTNVANYDFSIDSQAWISAKSLEGNITVEKIYDRFYYFETTDFSSLSGIVEKDKDRLKLSFENTNNEVGNDKPKKITNKNFYLDGVVTSNYVISNDQIKPVVKPVELSLLNLGDTLFTPYIDGVNVRYFALAPRNGVLSWSEPTGTGGTTYHYEKATLTITPKNNLDSGVILDNADSTFTVDNKNYTLKKEKAPKYIKVVNVDKSLDDMSTPFSIGAGEYAYCYVDIKGEKGITVSINGDDKKKVQLVPVSSKGSHSYSGFEDIVNFSPSTERRYLFLYSEEGASNLTLTYKEFQ